jgi:hypothetical protein
MKTQSLLFLTATTLVVASPVLMGQNSIPNPLIDYNGFQKIVDTADKERES